MAAAAGTEAESRAVLAELESIAASIYQSLDEGQIPEMQLPTRSKSNIVFNEQQRVWRYGKSRTSRSAKKLDGALMLLRTTYLLEFIRAMVGEAKSSTLRELYYISEGWDLAKFKSQDESNRLVEDLEIVTRYMREAFKMRPEEDGARVLGNITLTEVNRRGRPMRINCREDVGDAGYGIPYRVDDQKLTFEEFGDCRFILAIETGGMFDRLAENGFDESHGAVLVHLKGQPARSTRGFLQRMHRESGLPLLVFTDADPWSYRIFASIAVGAIKTAHISHILATPATRYLGVTPSDIINYELPSDDLTPQDAKALRDIQSDPRFADDFWRSEVELQLELGRKSEQQALAKYGLDFVTETYLPEKLAEMGVV